MIAKIPLQDKNGKLKSKYKNVNQMIENLSRNNNRVKNSEILEQIFERKEVLKCNPSSREKLKQFLNSSQMEQYHIYYQLQNYLNSIRGDYFYR
jgi:hypothetical protein